MQSAYFSTAHGKLQLVTICIKQRWPHSINQCTIQYPDSPPSVVSGFTPAVFFFIFMSSSLPLSSLLELSDITSFLVPEWLAPGGGWRTFFTSLGMSEAVLTGFLTVLAVKTALGGFALGLVFLSRGFNILVLTGGFGDCSSGGGGWIIGLGFKRVVFSKLINFSRRNLDNSKCKLYVF